ncbi:Coiled-coil domain-containing protein 11, partial [Globisporangium splendens]
MRASAILPTATCNATLSVALPCAWHDTEELRSTEECNLARSSDRLAQADQSEQPSVLILTNCTGLSSLALNLRASFAPFYCKAARRGCGLCATQANGALPLPSPALPPASLSHPNAPRDPVVRTPEDSRASSIFFRCAAVGYAQHAPVATLPRFEFRSSQSGGSPVTEDEEEYTTGTATTRSTRRDRSATGRRQYTLADLSKLLHRAAQTGDAKRIAKILKKAGNHVDIDHVDVDGFTALHLACVGGHEDAVHELVTSGAKIEATTPEGFTALMFAAWKGALYIVSYLVAHGANLKAMDVDGNDAAYIAQMNDHTPVVEYLRQAALQPVPAAKSDPNTPNASVKIVDKSFGELSVEETKEQEWKKSVASLSSPEKSSSPGGKSDEYRLLDPEFTPVTEVIAHEDDDNEDANSEDVVDSNGATPLLIAAMHGQLETVEVLIERGANLAASIPGGATSLHLAAGSGHLEIVKYLHNQGMDLMTRTDKGITPLHEAALEGHVEVVKYLLTHGADVNAAMDCGTTPLHNAAENGHVQVAELLIAHGAHVEAVTKDFNPGARGTRKDSRRRGSVTIAFPEIEGSPEVSASINEKELSSNQVALSLAAKNGHLDMVEYLLREGTMPTPRSERDSAKHPLLLAAARGHVDVVRYLLANCGATLRDAESRLLSTAAECGHLQIVEHALAKGANINATFGKRQTTPLILAARNGHLSVVLHLLWSGAHIEATNSNGYTALHYAARHGHLNVVNSLLLNGAQVDAVCTAKQTSPLHLAAQSGHEDVVRCLLSFDANVNAENTGTITALHIAAERGHAGVVKELLVHGANIEAVSQTDVRPLYIAAYHGHLDVVKLLVEAGAAMEVTSSLSKATPLRAAVTRGFPQVAEFLLSKGADANTRDANDSTCLHSAASNGSGEMIRLLLAAGANPDALDVDGRSPLEFAASDPIQLQLRLALLKAHWQNEDHGKQR